MRRWQLRIRQSKVFTAIVLVTDTNDPRKQKSSGACPIRLGGLFLVLALVLISKQLITRAKASQVGAVCHSAGGHGGVCLLRSGLPTLNRMVGIGALIQN